jgi:hypothetical protein
MHQDIKTFSDILDIDTQDQLQLHLVIESHGNIHYRMRLNGHLISDTDTTYTVGLFSTVNLKCTVFEANGGAVEIKLLAINGQEVLPKYQHLAQPSTAWIDQEGTWEFTIDQPFYPWFHKISGQGWLA